jgi:dGTPase
VRIPLAKEFAAFKGVAKKKVYSAKPVVEIEACGFEVISRLLEAFVNAIEVKAQGSGVGKARSRTILSPLPGGADSVEGKAPYERMLVATDFVAGMTDTYALELYQHIHGIRLP